MACCNRLCVHSTAIAITSCLFGFGILAYIALQLCVLVYSIEALVGGSAQCETNDAFNWIKFICVFSAIYCIGLASKGKEGSVVPDLKDVPMAITVHVAWGFAFGMATMLKFHDECSGDARDALAVYGYGSLATSGTILVTCFAAWVVDFTDGPKTPAATPVADTALYKETTDGDTDVERGDETK